MRRAGAKQRGCSLRGFRNGRRFARAAHPVLETVKTIVGDTEEKEIPASADDVTRACRNAMRKRGHGFTL